MRIVSWNVNGLRAILGKGLLDLLPQMNADMLCLQEIKAMPEQVTGIDWGSTACTGIRHSARATAAR